MPKYRYKAKDEKGSAVSGVLQAADEEQLHQKLRQEGKYLISARPVDGGGDRGRQIRPQSLAEFCRQIGTLTGSGVSLVRALGIVAEDESNKKYERAVYADLLRLVRQGQSLSNAMEEQGEAFPELLINMFRAAETGGNLDSAAMRMAVYYDKQHRLNSKVKSSTLYPKILCGMIVVVVIFMVYYVLPQFEELFSQMESLPLATRILFAISRGVEKHWLLLLILAAVLVTVGRFVLHIPSVAIQVDKLKLRLPYFGNLLKVIYTARFARTVSSLYASGIPIVQTLQTGRKTIGNSYIDSQFDSVIARVRSGESLSDALEPVEGFVKKLGSAVRVGEETGSLDKMLTSSADSLEYESEIAINKMVTSMEPLLIIVMGLVVGFIMLAVLLPIYGSYDAIGNTTY